MLIGTAVVLGLLVALLAIPVTLRFEVAWDRTLRQDIRLLWAFGLLRVRLGPRAARQARERAAEAEAPERERPRAERKATKRKVGPFGVLNALRLQRFRRRILRFVGALWRAVRTRDLSLRLRLGLEDPAATGQLWALLGPIAGLLASRREVSIIIEPAFSEPALELAGRGSVRVVPLELLGLVAALALSPAVWQGVRALRGRA